MHIERLCYEMASVTLVDVFRREGHARNFYICLNSPSSWISAHQSANGYYDNIIPIFQTEESFGYEDVIFATT